MDQPAKTGAAHSLHGVKNARVAACFFARRRRRRESPADMAHGAKIVLEILWKTPPTARAAAPDR